MMTYEEVTEKLVQAFNELADEKQVGIMEQHLSEFGQDVDIFPMSQFDMYCKERWHDHYSAFAETMQNTSDFDFDFNDLWCMYSKTDNAFESAETPADFSYGDDELTETLLVNTAFLLHEMNFSWDELDEMEDAYNEEQGE